MACDLCFVAQTTMMEFRVCKWIGSLFVYNECWNLLVNYFAYWWMKVPDDDSMLIWEKFAQCRLIRLKRLNRLKYSLGSCVIVVDGSVIVESSEVSTPSVVIGEVSLASSLCVEKLSVVISGVVSSSIPSALEISILVGLRSLLDWESIKSVSLSLLRKVFCVTKSGDSFSSKLSNVTDVEAFCCEFTRIWDGDW